MTYSEFYRLACQMASVLKNQFHLQHGDRVAVLCLNELEYVVLYFALQRLGAILVPINYRLTSREVSHIITDCDPALIVYQNEFISLIQNYTKNKIQLDELSKIADSAKLYPSFDSKKDDASMIIYTSGTTGSPKGAVISLNMIFWNSLNTTLRLNISQTDCAVIFLPFFHTGGWNVLTTPFLHRGASLVFLKKFDADQILNLSDKHEATLLFGVPTTMDMMARSKSFESVKLKNLRYAIVGGEPMPLELIHKWHHKGIAIRQGYGLTEFGPNVFSLNEEHALTKMGSIGFPNFYCEAKIVDEKDQELGADLVGELLLKGPMAMSKYWNNPKATEETFVDGWLRTGDLAKKDQEGFYYIVGRKKDMFKSGGENVYPAELEKVIRQYPGIREAAVIGVPDEKWGEVGKAFISLEKADHLDENGLRDHCLKNLAKFKVPKYFHVLNELPKGDSGKILKRALSSLVSE
jgi:fatty-acyl-CoA synthase